MSYTAPQYVDTKEQAILALASTIKGEAVTGGDGSVNRALDILADVLADQDVQVPQTDAGAILALAQYVSGGGGGDFSTAAVTITNESDKSFMLAVPLINRGTLVSVLNSADMDGTAEETAIYGTGAVALVIGDNLPNTITCTGGVSDLGNGAILIEGDGTLTFSEQQH